MWDDIVYGQHPSQRTLLAACAMDVNNYLFNFPYDVVSSEKIKDWVWFLQMVGECMRGLKPMIMSDKNLAIFTTLAQIFSKEYHNYCLCDLMENFLNDVAEHGIRK